MKLFQQVVLIGILFLVISCGNNGTPIKPQEDASDSAFLASAGSMAMNYPDQFNWEVFARICQTAKIQETVPDTTLTTNNALWEEWADDELTYPSSPSLNSVPQFPTEGLKKHKKLNASTQQSIANHFRKNQALFLELGGGEEVRRNKASFDFIIQNNLWYTQGLAENFAKGTANGAYNPLSFPIDAIEVKAMWKPIDEKDKSKYHWNYDEKGKLFGMVALHIMTKAIPNWTWATWEWVDNTGRCDDMGCIDNFGVNPGIVNPNPGATNQPKPKETGKIYPAGTLTPALLALFKKYNLSDEWKNYRLKGSQIDWIDATGRPILLANSVTEDGFVATSSCITCHSVASFDANGNFNPSVGFDTTYIIEGNQQSQNGAVNPNNFWKNGKQIYYQGDFVWGVLKVNPLK